MKRSTWWRSPNDSSPDEDLRPYFDALRETDYQDSFDPMMHWLERTRQPRPLTHRFIPSKVIHMTIYLRSHRLQLAVASMFLAVIFAACTLPIEQEETLGYLLSGTISGPQTKETLHALQRLDWPHPESIEMQFDILSRSADSVTAIQFAIAWPEAEHAEATQQADELRALDGVNAVQVQPLHMTVKRPAYKAALHSMTGGRWTIKDTELKAELEQIIARHLNELGQHGVSVQSTTLPDGSPGLTFSVPDDFDADAKRSVEKLVRDLNARTKTAEQNGSLHQELQKQRNAEQNRQD